MEKTNFTGKEVTALRYSVSKNYTKDGEKFRLDVKISLDDDCKNMCCDWSITGDIYKIAKNGRLIYWGGGCIHEDIPKHFPKLKKFVVLHLSDCHGAPMYAVENGYYIMNKEGKENAREYLRATDEEINILSTAGDKQYFKFLLFRLGIVAKWQKESDEAIKELETLTGYKWVNPYKSNEERRHVLITDEEVKEISNKIESGYYTPEAVKAREEKARAKAIEKKRNEIINDCKKGVEKLERQRDIMLYILDSGLPVDNVIYYDHTNIVVFNWMDYREKVTQADFIDFVNNVDYSRLPEGITFEIK